VEQRIETELISGVLHEPDAPRGDVILLSHGAGSNKDAPLLVRLARVLADSGYFVLRYDLVFRRSGRKGPPVPAVAVHDRAAIIRTADEMRKLASGRIIAGGHSYGGRQTAMAAAEHAGLADALLLLSYPLHPPKKPEQKRTAFFHELRLPVLFVHGTADPFASPEELRDAISLIPARTDLLLVEGAAHDLKRSPDLAPELETRLRALLS
jgi:predicted alpha/beta-hydrolase family hydrolase